LTPITSSCSCFKAAWFQNELLDFEKPVQESFRFRELEALVVEHGLPWLAAVMTIDGAREYCSTQSTKSALITKEAMHLFKFYR
jgi:hypothetical protein